jgi:hypothetical protein
MTMCIRKTTWPVACMALAIVILFSASAAMGAGGGAADGHVGGLAFQTTPPAPVARVARPELWVATLDPGQVLCAVGVAGQGLYLRGDNLIECLRRPPVRRLLEALEGAARFGRLMKP